MIDGNLLYDPPFPLNGTHHMTLGKARETEREGKEADRLPSSSRQRTLRHFPRLLVRNLCARMFFLATTAYL